MNNKTRLICAAALFVALVAVVTMLVRVPISYTNGYKNLGDAVIMISGVFFGPLIGFLVGGVGSMIADFVLGYAHYAWATLIIKGIEGLIVALIYQRQLKKKGDTYLPFLIASIIGGLWMCGGYFLVNWLYFADFYVALSGVIGNLIQAGIGVAVASLLYFTLKPFFSRYRKQTSSDQSKIG